jgi:uncharacterized protein YggE
MRYNINILLVALQSASVFLNGETLSQTSTLSVRGHAEMFKPADLLTMSVGMVTQGDNAETALKENNTSTQNIIDSLGSLGLSENEITTGQFSIRPIYSERPRSSSSNWQPHIIGYEVTNSLNIKTDKIKLAGTIIDSATRAGANTINNIHFGLKDPRMYREEVIASAAAHAFADAQALSKSTRVTLHKVSSVSLDDAKMNPAIARIPYLAKDIEMATIPIEPGDVEVSAAVTIVYEID